MRREITASRASLAALLATIATALVGSSPSATSQESLTLDALAQRAAALERDIARLEDHNAVKKLQRIYGFYTDKQLWTQAADLFAANGTIEVGGRGVYVGKERVLELLKQNGPEFPQLGRLFDQMQLQPIVHVAPDGQTAKGRWHMFAQEAEHGEYANWGLGVFENDYVKEDGVWKIQNLHLYTTMYTPYTDGWGKIAIPNAGPSADLPPDRPPSVDYEAYPAAFVVPFHYENPVTGKPVHAEVPAVAAPAASAADVDAKVAALDGRVGLLEDVTQLERMNSIYGYYLAHLQWDDLTGIFSPSGSIEIAMRGVYVGAASVRRNLNLYGQATDSQFGLQHNHMQFQPVITVSPDGQSAKMRSRALSIMGQWERYSQWMGGVYENEYVKENGVWKIKRDQVFNTYFVPYAVGWKDSVPRPPPGITDSNPPDSPPTLPFEMYPAPFLPPLHYPNPVTGETVHWSPAFAASE
jgi:SnoaL-like protein